MQEEKVTKKRGITEEDKEEFSHMTETDGQVRSGQMRKGCFLFCSVINLINGSIYCILLPGFFLFV